MGDGLLGTPNTLTFWWVRLVFGGYLNPKMLKVFTINHVFILPLNKYSETVPSGSTCSTSRLLMK